jgi:hypothetical protein
MVVGLVTVTLFAVIPEPLKLIDAGDAKFVPVSVIVGVVAPSSPIVWLSIVKVGASAVTVNCTTLAVVTPSVVTKTVCGPGVAPAAIVNVAVIVVGLVTVTLFAVIPEPLNVTDAGATKFVPVSVIVEVVVPVFPLVTLSMPSVGGASTVNVTAFVVVTPPVVTNTVCGPTAAPAAIVNVAVIVVELITVTLFAVIPEPLKLIDAGDPKFAPVSVTVGVVVPCAPMLTLSMPSAGGSSGIIITCVELDPQPPSPTAMATAHRNATPKRRTLTFRDPIEPSPWAGKPFKDQSL